MSEQLKYIVQELNKSPFNKNFNLISFDSLEPVQRLQVFTDVLAEIDPKQRIDVRTEAADQTAIRLLNGLRILKYKPPEEIQNLQAFRQGIVQGDKLVIYPIIEWLFQNRDSLKKRAYLAQYLVRIDIPTEFQTDDQISELYTQYESLVEDFKAVHKECEQLKNNGFKTSDIKKDISDMEDEKEQLIKRVDRLKRKVESVPNSGPMLAMARDLRTERDKKEKITQHKNEQKNLIVQAEQRMYRLRQQLNEQRQSSIGVTPQGLIQKLEEENKVNTYMLQDKLPRELNACKTNVTHLKRVIAEPAMGKSDLDEINKKISDCNSEINQLVEKRMMSGDPREDKISLFRQQAAIIARKKEKAAEHLQEVREDFARLESECNEKRAKSSTAEGVERMKPDDFSRFVNLLRSKSTVYKKKRSELSDLRAEAGVLSRTIEILRNRDDNAKKHMSQLESKQGVSGFRETQEALETVSALKSEMDSMKGRTLEDISFFVNKLHRKIAEKKNSLAPIIKELRPMREKANAVTAEYDEKKSNYDTVAAGLESNRSKLEQEVRALREECSAEESRYHYLNSMEEILHIQQKEIENEMKAYVSHNPADKKNSLRDQYTRKIQEQENLGKGLREKQKHIRDNMQSSIKQMGMWRDFHRLMECKIQCHQEKKNGGFGGNNANGFSSKTFKDSAEDRLILD